MTNNKNLEGSSSSLQSSSNEEESLITPTLRVYKARWLMLFLYCLTTMLNGSMFMGLSPVVEVVAPYYNVSAVHIEWLSNIFMVVYIFVAMPSAYVMSKYGVRVILVVASGCGAAAATIQYAGYKHKSYMFVVIGQFFASIAFGNILQIPGKLSAVWFAPHERGTSTAIGVFMNILGVSFGFVQPAHMIPDVADRRQIETGLRYFFMSKMVAAILIFIMTVTFFKERPPTPPSHATLDGGDELSFFKSLKILLKDKNFMLMAQAYGIYFGLYTCVSVIVSTLVSNQFKKINPAITEQIGWMGFSCNIAAAVSCYLFGLFLDRTSKYKLVALFLNIGSTILWLVFIMVLTKTTNFPVVFTVYVIFGTVGIPYFASGVEHALEMTSPVPEGTTSTVILTLGNLYGFTFILGFGELLENGYLTLTLYTILGLYALSSLFLCISKTELKRSEAENEWINTELDCEKKGRIDKTYGTHEDGKWSYVIFHGTEESSKVPRDI